MKFYRYLMKQLILGLLALSLLGCGSDSEPADNNAGQDNSGSTNTATEDFGDFQVSSTAFNAGDSLPEDYACSRDGGGDLSPPVTWSGAPEGVTEYALVMYHYPQGQTDNPSHYWLVWNIPSTINSLDAGNLESIGNEGSNKDGVAIGYTPPCSPGDAVHEYTIRVYALSAAPEALGSSDNVSVGWAEFVAAVEPLSLGMTEFSFTN